MRVIKSLLPGVANRSNFLRMSWREKMRLHLRHDPAAYANPEIPGSPVLSSVLIPIGHNVPMQRDEIVLTKRTMTVETHKGQISFPGGLREADDKTLLDTALREASEEVGLSPSHVDVLGPLDSVVTRGDVLIYPWVGLIELPYPFVMNQGEVDKILLLPLDRLIEEGLRPVQVEVAQGMRVKSIGITVEGELVWGATAKMLEGLRDRLLRL